jgi:hypothetical protein
LQPPAVEMELIEVPLNLIDDWDKQNYPILQCAKAEINWAENLGKNLVNQRVNLVFTPRSNKKARTRKRPVPVFVIGILGPRLVLLENRGQRLISGCSRTSLFTVTPTRRRSGLALAKKANRSFWVSSRSYSGENLA